MQRKDKCQWSKSVFEVEVEPDLVKDQLDGLSVVGDDLKAYWQWASVVPGLRDSESGINSRVVQGSPLLRMSVKYTVPAPDKAIQLQRILDSWELHTFMTLHSEAEIVPPLHHSNLHASPNEHSAVKLC